MSLLNCLTMHQGYQVSPAQRAKDPSLLHRARDPRLSRQASKGPQLSCSYLCIAVSTPCHGARLDTSASGARASRQLVRRFLLCRHAIDANGSCAIRRLHFNITMYSAHNVILEADTIPLRTVGP